MADGLVVVDKPAGWTSHDVVARCRRLFGQKRVGHSGTLDPDATGVLLVGLGRATRLLRYLTDLPKSYVGEVVLGTATSTLDASGDVTGEWPMSHVTLDDARTAATQFVGPILQTPPMVSALKVDGRRLHELAREGVEVERRPRPVTVHRYDITEEVEAGVLRVEVDCSSGTYVRTLAADLGAALGGGAHLRNLRRVGIGSFGLGVAHTLEQIELDPPATVLSPADAMRDYPRVAVPPDVEAAVLVGKVLERDTLGLGSDGPHAVCSVSTGELLAVYEPHKGTTAKPSVVLAG